MLELLKQQLNPGMSSNEKVNRAREFLQLLILKIMCDKGQFKNLVFVGGTALRIIYNLRRFSEDMDFSLIAPEGYDFAQFVSQLERELKLSGFSLEVKNKRESTVNGIMVKFSGLLYELGISPLKSQKIMIKVEVDINPPKGGVVENTLVNKVFLLNLAHFDLSSLFATKMHACFYRKYVKGRDFYDLLWYVVSKIKPNFVLLNNAIEQTQKHNPGISESNFEEFLSAEMEKIDFGEVKRDVSPFLENPDELQFLEKDIIKKAIASNY